MAALFDTEPSSGANYLEVVAPTGPGLVISQSQVRAMAWGFPRTDPSKVTGEMLKPHPIYNARADKIGSKFWRGSFARRRCLVPITAWAEPEGKKGKMTRTWFSLPGEEIFAVAGIWRRSDEWGHVFSMMTVPAHEAMLDLNDRMPVDLPPSEWPKICFRFGHEGGLEWRGSTSRKRSSASCVKRRSCWRRAERWRMRVAGSASPSRATTAGARSMAA
ncbi:SOS response-associated peptidase [Novosphingobium aerophilum]|uniref:SOS response-associated peptidase n=1 Tax=Novosphingobium aerophilum TaxID=2839843 RepID=UPI003FD02AEB